MIHVCNKMLNMDTTPPYLSIITTPHGNFKMTVFLFYCLPYSPLSTQTHTHRVKENKRESVSPHRSWVITVHCCAPTATSEMISQWPVVYNFAWKQVENDRKDMGKCCEPSNCCTVHNEAYSSLCCLSLVGILSALWKCLTKKISTVKLCLICNLIKQQDKPHEYSNSTEDVLIGSC